ncbi:relaxase/mobilization nuclease domain-containing protein [Desulfovibrio aerotolerans]|uniref:Relaxase/mobilization nuclease domain-containing protein n=1 Tax=Solidesulfovibrio aerotolerans TaxID=295255 RepID=A0A7C9N3N0_9BACT|nr:relaxase/mobilization nuclease domain-containing protein [Solidesulfovibrio aerotolerans]MYL81815.1 relaxase/mobilization nuclease domain-containing protein [Solidesulfovibrio aerotolerans]
MKIKKIKTKDKSRRSAKASAAYLISEKTNDSQCDDVEFDKTNGVSETNVRVLASGSLNTFGNSFDEGRKELELLDKSYKGRGDAVGHYMLAWRAGETPTKEKKIDAINILLKNVGFKNHPCIWVEHGDRPHPHVHLLVSRIDPDSDPIRPDIKNFGGMVQLKSTRKKKEILHTHEEFCCARAEAEICHDQGWEPTPNALYSSDLQLVERNNVQNELKLRPRILTYEAHHNKPHPARILGNTAIDVLKKSSSWEEAFELFAKKAISLERVQKGPKNREGAYLRSGRTSLKLSALPNEFSLKNLDKKFGKPVSDQEKPEPAIACELALHVVAAKPISENYSLKQIKNVLKKSVSDALSWKDFLNDLKRENWKVERAGGGALIVAGEHRVKISQIPGKNSYSKLCSKFGQTIEEANLSCDLLNIVQYHEAISPKITNKEFFDVETEVIHSNLNSPSLAQEKKIQVEVQYPKRKIIIEAQSIIRTSMTIDTSIQHTTDRLFVAGFSVKFQTYETSDGRIFASNLTFEKNDFFVSLNNLSEDCNKLSKIGEAFGERYNKPLPQNFINRIEKNNGFIDFVKKCFSLITRFIPNYKKFETKHRTFSNNMSIAQKVQIIESQKAIIGTQQLAIHEERHAIR